MSANSTFKDWAIAQHINTNHLYDGAMALPYSYHLQLVVDVLYKFKPLIDGLYVSKRIEVPFEVLEAAGWGHDLIEDARVTYNDVMKALTKYTHFSTKEINQCAEIIRVVTNYTRGRNRKERMPDWLYDEIKETPGADIVKLADRAGNLKHGLLKNSSQKEMYKKEYPHFKEKLYDKKLQPIFDYIEKLIDTEL